MKNKLQEGDGRTFLWSCKAIAKWFARQPVKQDDIVNGGVDVVSIGISTEFMKFLPSKKERVDGYFFF